MLPADAAPDVAADAAAQLCKHFVTCRLCASHYCTATTMAHDQELFELSAVFFRVRFDS